MDNLYQIGKAFNDLCTFPVLLVRLFNLKRHFQTLLEDMYITWCGACLLYVDCEVNVFPQRKDSNLEESGGLKNIVNTRNLLLRVKLLN
ncbi:hypothetical protein XENTR_v10006239 [Xenopus tropicalis]|nr:hypothetical protein XENTR_v10006239 [Xenopus tropicalis]